MLDCMRASDEQRPHACDRFARRFTRPVHPDGEDEPDRAHPDHEADLPGPGFAEAERCLSPLLHGGSLARAARRRTTPRWQSPGGRSRFSSWPRFRSGGGCFVRRDGSTAARDGSSRSAVSGANCSSPPAANAPSSMWSSGRKRSPSEKAARTRANAVAGRKIRAARPEELARPEVLGPDAVQKKLPIVNWKSLPDS